MTGFEHRFEPCCERDTDGDGNCDWHIQVQVMPTVLGRELDTIDVRVPRALYANSRASIIEAAVQNAMDFGWKAVGESR